MHSLREDLRRLKKIINQKNLRLESIDVNKRSKAIIQRARMLRQSMGAGYGGPLNRNLNRARIELEHFIKSMINVFRLNGGAHEYIGMTEEQLIEEMKHMMNVAEKQLKRSIKGFREVLGELG